ncbi:MAG TPA: GTPase ObgE [Chthoniobacteraceae bacterium]|jgi:GTP-binding protein|nr:GTPase ObgE [Chthoniobacteraceae bacterium]
MFVDHIKITAQAGDGGNGCVSFRREAFVPRGGPNGGDGGRGSSIVLHADTHTDNLTSFFYEPIIKGRHGGHGMGKECYGKSAEDKILRVPVGTIVYRLQPPEERTGLEASVEYGTSAQYINLEKSPEDVVEPAEGEEGGPEPLDVTKLEIIVDLTEPGQEFVLCKGGKGGKGNVHFKSSQNRVPTQFTYGEEGEKGTYYLELRKIADVGLVGYPNAGKSTLLTKVSAARPKVAAYPFTTLTPHIGVVETPGYQRFTVADIPGLIEGAHANVGLGHEFLRHIVRCKLLAFVVDIAGTDGREPVADLESLRREINLYDKSLSERPWIVVANKMDHPDAEEKLKAFRQRFREKVEIIAISAADETGVAELKKRLSDLIAEGEAARSEIARAAEAAQAEAALTAAVECEA